MGCLSTNKKELQTAFTDFKNKLQNQMVERLKIENDKCYFDNSLIGDVVFYDEKIARFKTETGLIMEILIHKK